MPYPDPRTPPVDGVALSRRDLIARGLACAAGGGLWVGGLRLGQPLARACAARTDPEPRARAVIHLFLQGGLSHLDTFDPKPDAPVEIRGSLRAVDTAVADLQFTELCAKTARVADRLVVFRGVTHTEADHSRGTHTMLTGYQPSPAVAYPSYGAIVSHELGLRNDLPPYVCIPDARTPELGTGYLSSAFGPFSLGGEPATRGFEVRDLEAPKSVDAARASRRRRLVDELDRRAAGDGGEFVGRADAIEATRAFYQQAFDLIGSEAAREAFRIGGEEQATRDRYGMTAMGQRLLLARRLVAAGVRYVTVVDGGYDHHDEVDRNLRARMPPVDQAFAALIEDLDERGLLDSTLVLLTSEFGRTPRINATRGRDHWPRVFTVLAAGGGLRRGLVVGASDASGAEPALDAVAPADLAATMFELLGIDPTKRLLSPGDRPIDIVRGGRLLTEVLA
ncbi:MAG: DUF1501 domain-containing protein [Planctomycetes bacterium]|nr:DUF1501 domain-containing protein [Planctomycetota bacterium]